MIKNSHPAHPTLALLLSTALPLLAADPVVTNVASAQRAGTKLVDISFDVSDSDSDTLSISVEISDDSGASFVVPVTAISGDTSVNATPTPASKALVWDASIDFNQQFNANIVVRVIANDNSPPAGMALIPAGSFKMGRQSAGVQSDELPVHTVFVSAFYLDKFEVSKALWDTVKTYADVNGYSFDNAGSGVDATHPVQTVNWYDVVKWCNARSEQEGLTPVYYTNPAFATVYKTGQTVAPFHNWTANGYRLPTEAEWEKAARGSLVGNTYPWGTSITIADANYRTSGDPFEGNSVKTTPVGYYNGSQTPAGPNRANGYGLYDTMGNVWEWCWDNYAHGYYGASPATNPLGVSASGARVLRGGSWLVVADFLRCANRGGTDPVIANGSVGFRSARGL